MSLFNYTRRESHEVRIGSCTLGGQQPVRLQSMTTTPTTETESSVLQARAIIDAGGELVRLTTQGTREAENLRNIKAALRAAGYDQPLVADVHFNPNVADVAASVVEKVRINPGNYVDPARTFKHLEYTEEEYAAELQRLDRRFCRLLDICRQLHTALRIGVNHGSLSDRIMSRYGDTPEGIVESCLEFLRVCVREQFSDVVVSIKASNTVVMVQSVRLLCEAMQREGMTFPLHLGVTEAGEGEDGRIKSAAGIGALLADGIGDTIRVSLSEAPEKEIPVARQLAEYILQRKNHPEIQGTAHPDFCFVRSQRRPTTAVCGIGGTNVPVVLSDIDQLPDDLGGEARLADFYCCGTQLPTPEQEKCGAQFVADYPVSEKIAGVLPLFSTENVSMINQSDAPVKFLRLSLSEWNENVKATLCAHPETVVLATSSHKNRTGELRALIHHLWLEGLTNPVVIEQHHRRTAQEKEAFQIEAAADAGVLLFDGLVDGLFLTNKTAPVNNDTEKLSTTDTAFAILQATRSRITRTEYISCPGCGRTLYNLPQTIARIKAATGHLKGLKIGIMGCIVNGPGEMADADYGYVGAARGKVSLYRGKTCVEKNIPEADAVEKLLRLIESDRKGKVAKMES